MNKLINLIWIPEDNDIINIFDGTSMRVVPRPQPQDCPNDNGEC